MRVDVNHLFDSSSEISATLRSTESSVDDNIEVQEVHNTTKNGYQIVNNSNHENHNKQHNEHENESKVECGNDKIKATMSGTGTVTAGVGAVKPFNLSPYSMTCRRYTEDHSIGLRPWRLIKGSGDF